MSDPKIMSDPVKASQNHDECKNCTLRGHFEFCMDMPCSIHESWFVKTLLDKLGYNNPVKNSYEHCLCPDCGEDIPSNVKEGDECEDCGHAFYEAKEDDNPDPDGRLMGYIHGGKNIS